MNNTIISEFERYIDFIQNEQSILKQNKFRLTQLARVIKMYTPGMKERDNPYGDNPYNVTDTRNKDINTWRRDTNQGMIRYTDFGVTGGSDWRQLDIREMPAHNHSSSLGAMGTEDNGTYLTDHRMASSIGWNRDLNFTSFTNSTGGNESFGINSPYYTLVYIIYIG